MVLPFLPGKRTLSHVQPAYDPCGRTDRETKGSFRFAIPPHASSVKAKRESAPLASGLSRLAGGVAGAAHPVTESFPPFRGQGLAVLTSRTAKLRRVLHQTTDVLERALLQLQHHERIDGAVFIV